MLLAGQHAQCALALSSPCTAATHSSRSLPARSGPPSALERSALAAWVPKRGRCCARPCPKSALILLPLTIQAGREYDLVVLSVLTYGTFDMIFEDTFIAIFATYLVDLVVRFARRDLAKKNIAAKTLIDDRLLL